MASSNHRGAQVAEVWLLPLNGLVVAGEAWGHHPTEDGRRAARLIQDDRRFTTGVLALGHLLPLTLLWGAGPSWLALRTRDGVPTGALPDDPELVGLLRRSGSRATWSSRRCCCCASTPRAARRA